MGSGCCRVHGGKSLSGIASPSYKDGLYVKSLPKRYLQNYDQARNNPDYLKLQDSIGVVDARLMELMSGIDEKASSHIFNSLISYVNQMEKSQAVLVRSQNIRDEEQRARVREKANTEFLESINEIARLVKSGAKEWYIWNDITELIEKRRRLVETERRLLVDMNIMVRIEETFTRFNILMESIRRNVPDRNIRAAIQSDYNLAIGR